MGKRKSSGPKPGGSKKKEVLATTFQCLFCNHENSVIVRLDKKTGQGHLNCKVCGQTFSSQINYLSAAVDVYSDWIDACDAVQTGGVKESVEATRIPAPNRVGTIREEERDLEGFIEDDEVPAEAEYDDE